jgi:hypothetical protein
MLGWPCCAQRTNRPGGNVRGASARASLGGDGCASECMICGCPLHERNAALRLRGSGMYASAQWEAN